MTILDEEKLAGVTFHALVFDRRREWNRTCDALLRFLGSREGQQHLARTPEPTVVLTSNPRRGHPYYLHVTDGALAVLRRLNVHYSVFTSAFFFELPEDQHLKFCSPDTYVLG